ncbi:MAG: hypothetical protein NZL83_00885 [Candidatus Absconditabacterales bacterium]|nr:hypothetical protein [Candidatus Absconditabacterales bacterium]
MKLCQDKELTQIILKDYPFPQSTIITKSESISSGLTSKTWPLPKMFPLVVKPADKSHGIGISIGISSYKDLEQAIAYAFEYSTKVIIQEYISGNDYRILVVGDKISAIAMRKPPYIIGDGQHTIHELINQENHNPMRGEGHDKPLTKIKIDTTMISFLEKQGYTISSIPRVNEEVLLRQNANLSTGGISFDVTDIVHPSTKQMALDITKKLGICIAGIDIISVDITKPLQETNGKIIEVNSTPGLRMHHFPHTGIARNCAKDILQLRFE